MPGQLALTGTARDDVARVRRGKQKILQAAQVFVAPLRGAKSDEWSPLYEAHALDYSRHAYGLQTSPGNEKALPVGKPLMMLARPERFELPAPWFVVEV